MITPSRRDPVAPHGVVQQVRDSGGVASPVDLGAPQPGMPLDPGARFTIAEAAHVCGVSVDTVKRRLRAGALPGASRRPGDGNGTWLIPAPDLVGAGLLPAAAVADAAGLAEQRRELREVGLLRQRVAEMDAALQAAERLLCQRDEEVAFLRRLVERSLRGGA